MTRFPATRLFRSLIGARLSGRRRRLRLERLEQRDVPQATLYVDFGDNFAGGVLNTTVGDLITTTNGANPPMAGPRLFDDSGAGYADATAVSITSLDTIYGTLTPLTRATIIALTRRFYEPLDITVVDLSPTPQMVNGHSVSSATSLLDISATLGVNEGDPRNNDAYVIVGRYAIGAAGDNPTQFPTNGYGGLSSGIDIGGANSADNTAFVCLRNMTEGLYSPQFLGDQVAHEAGHLFGLRHSFGNNPATPPPGSLINLSIHQSDLMSYSGYASFGGFNFFSRFPMTRGDGNLDRDKLSAASPPAPAGMVTPFDQLASDGEIGPAAVQYVTGTGAFNTITLTKTGADEATVTVSPFDDAAYTTTIIVPGSAPSTSFSYKLNLTTPILIDSGSRADRIVIDASLGANITLRGMAGDDSLTINGMGAATGSYVPGLVSALGLDNNFDRFGTVTVGSTVVNFREFDPDSTVTVSGVTTFNFVSPGDADDLQITSPAPGQNQISGKVNDGTPIVPLVFFDIPNFTIDTGNNDGATPDDIVAIDASGLKASGLQIFTVTTGKGNDSLQLDTGNFTLPVAGGAFNYLGGADDDEILATANVDFTLSDIRLESSGGGSINLTSVEIATLTGGSSANALTVSNWTGTANLDGAGNGDTYTINLNGTAGTVNVNDTGATGTDAVQVNGTSKADQFTVTNASVSTAGETVNYAGIETLGVDGRDGGDGFKVQSTSGDVTTTLMGSAEFDTFTIKNAASSLDDILGPLFIDGGLGFNLLGLTDSGDADSMGYQLTKTFFVRTGTALIAYTSIGNMLLIGSKGNNNYAIQGTGATSLTAIADGDGSSTVTVDGDGLQGACDIQANGGDDQVTVKAGTGIAASKLTISGNAHSATGKDRLITVGRTGNDIMTLTYQLGTASKGTGSSLEGLGQALEFDTFEQVNIDGNGGAADNLKVVDGTDLAMGGANLLQANSIVYRPVDADSGDLRLNGKASPTGGIASLTPSQTPFTVFDNITGSFTVSGGAKRDTLVVLGVSEMGLQDATFQETTAPEGEDTITVTDALVTLVNKSIGPMLSVQVDTATFNNIVVRAGNEAPIVGDDVTVTPSTKLNIFLDGMDPMCGTPGDKLTVITVGPRTIFRQIGDDENKGPNGHVRIRDEATGGEVGFIHFESVTGAGLVVVGTDAGAKSTVLALDASSGTPRFFLDEAFPGFYGGVRVAAGDLNGDGIADVVAAAGPGGGPHVRAFDGIDGTQIASFFAYAAEFRGGVNVAVGDTLCDGTADIITGPAGNGGPHVRVFDNTGTAFKEFFAYAPTFLGGVNVAAGDIDGDGAADIVTGAGEGGGPHVIAFRGTDLAVLRSFFAYDPTFRGGVYVAVGDVDGDLQSEIVTGAGNGGGPHLRVFNSTGVLREFFVNDPFTPGQEPQIPRETGLRVALADVDGDGILDVLTGKGPGTRPRVRAFHIPAALTEAVRGSVFNESLYGQGIFVGGSR